MNPIDTRSVPAARRASWVVHTGARELQAALSG
jgi:hypothetical protein